MNDETVVLELNGRELAILTEGVNATMQLLSKTLEKHRNHKDYSMEKLFVIMEMYANTGDLWLKLHKTAGITQEEIAEYLEQQGDK
jgi:hypothetical protein